MRFAVISDVHGNLPALQRVVAHLKAQAADAVINLGDCVSAPLWPQETFEELQTLKAITVRGNHDRWLGDPERARVSPTVAFTLDHLSDSAVATLVALPMTHHVTAEVFAVHGTPASDVEYLLEDAVNDRLCLTTTAALNDRLEDVDAELVLCGHSHQQNSVWSRNGRLVLNPGAVGAPRYAGNTEPQRNEAGSPHARYAIATRRAGRWSAELFVLDYDWDLVIERARQVGREDWAAAFVKEA